MQKLPLEIKIEKTKLRIQEWYESWNGQVYISFSGGKDSTVLLDLIRQIYPDVPAVFVDTGLEYPEIKDFTNSFLDVETIFPQMNFRQVIKKYGYPVASKKISLDIHKLRHQNLNEKYRNYLLNGDERGCMGKLPEQWKCLLEAPFEVHDACCNVMKKKPFKAYGKRTGRHPYTGELAEDSKLRTTNYLINGCNGFNLKVPKSMPLGFWTEQDILQYIFENKLPICSIYGNIVKHKNGKFTTTKVDRTGCVFCMFGVHKEHYPNRFQRMSLSHPQLYNYCMKDMDNGGLGLKKVLDYIGIESANMQMELPMD